MVHGYTLPHGTLQSFAQVHFRAGSSLTYPIACLWRQKWVHQPMRSLEAGPQVITAALESFKGLAFFQDRITIHIKSVKEEELRVNPPSELPHFRRVAAERMNTNDMSPSNVASGLASPVKAERRRGAEAGGMVEEGKWLAAAKDARRTGKRLLLMPVAMGTAAAQREAKRVKSLP
eukprot:4542832-Amphidinium_carterae.1